MVFVFLQHSIVSENKININRSCALLSNYYFPHVVLSISHIVPDNVGIHTILPGQLDFSVAVAKCSILVATISLKEHTPTFLPLGFL